jgi:type IV pilus assembly protein PilM
VPFLSKKSIGIDIADRSIVIVQLESKAGKVRISGFSRVSMAPGIVKRGKIRDEERLKAAVKEALEKAKPNIVNARKIIFGIPERRLFAHIFQINAGQKNKIEQIVAEEAKRSVPIEPSDLIFGYKILENYSLKTNSGQEPKQEVIFIATNKSFVRSWQAFFSKLDIEVEAFDVESLSIFRGLDKKDLNPPLMIMDIGAVSVNLSIFNRNGLFYSHSLSKAGDYFTRKIAESIRGASQKDLDLVEAEKLKIAYGITDLPEFAQIGQTIKVALGSTIATMKEAMEYFYFSTGETVKEIILVGGSSELKGLPKFLTESFTGFNPWIKQGSSGPELSPIKIKFGTPILSITEGPLFFVEAIGLSWRGLDKKWFKNDPYILPKEALTKDVEVIIKKKEDEESTEQTIGIQQNVAIGWVSAHKREVQLLAILIFGIIFIGGAFWYRGISRQKNMAKMNNGQLNQYNIAETLQLILPINTDTKNMASGQIRGRIFQNEVATAMPFTTALNNSFAETKKQLKKGETIWSSPINNISERSIVFPLKINWLVYSEQDANSLFLSEAKRLAGTKSDFLLNTISFDRLDRSRKASSTLFYLSATVNLSTKTKQKYETQAVINDLLPSEASTSPAIKTNVNGNNISNNSTQNNASSSGAIIDNNKTVESAANGSSTLSSVELLKLALEEARKNGVMSSLIIKNEKIGWINVRSGPGTTYTAIEKANTGEKYKIIEENDEWIKIELSDNKNGWVNKEYVEKASEK